MSDLIRRQDAIVEIFEAYENDETLDGYAYRIEELPDGIIHCSECKHAEHDKLFHELWCMGREVKPDHYYGYAERSASYVED